MDLMMDSPKLEEASMLPEIEEVSSSFAVPPILMFDEEMMLKREVEEAKPTMAQERSEVDVQLGTAPEMMHHLTDFKVESVTSLAQTEHNYVKQDGTLIPELPKKSSTKNRTEAKKRKQCETSKDNAIFRKPSQNGISSNCNEMAISSSSCVTCHPSRKRMDVQTTKLRRKWKPGTPSKALKKHGQHQEEEVELVRESEEEEEREVEESLPLRTKRQCAQREIKELFGRTLDIHANTKKIAEFLQDKKRLAKYKHQIEEDKEKPVSKALRTKVATKKIMNHWRKMQAIAIENQLELGLISFSTDAKRNPVPKLDLTPSAHAVLDANGAVSRIEGVLAGVVNELSSSQGFSLLAQKQIRPYDHVIKNTYRGLIFKKFGEMLGQSDKLISLEKLPKGFYTHLRGARKCRDIRYEAINTPSNIQVDSTDYISVVNMWELIQKAGDWEIRKVVCPEVSATEPSNPPCARRRGLRKRETSKRLFSDETSLRFSE